ncbi:hypothetical protein PRIPAC_89410 [Pristionchus pacificus]|uniref:Uncharacterized protein n=1 Tax=Pristionchus pacificus TaxID=54126 RepID=A0A2A6CW47_PRIPA|nr:hypothetical protein PRIPAC_89410 [Pristionchus pacificus]|eukprot:PDM82415.1 hypothetical protein PRIPAC_36808 [Pristionchus pacificus]
MEGTDWIPVRKRENRIKDQTKYLGWTLRLAHSHTAYIDASVLFRDAVFVILFDRRIKVHTCNLATSGQFRSMYAVELAADALGPLAVQAERLETNCEFTSANLISIRETITRSGSFTVVYVCNEIIDKLKSNLIREVHDDLKVLLEIRGENVLEDELFFGCCSSFHDSAAWSASDAAVAAVVVGVEEVEGLKRSESTNIRDQRSDLNGMNDEVVDGVQHVRCVDAIEQQNEKNMEKKLAWNLVISGLEGVEEVEEFGQVAHPRQHVLRIPRGHLENRQAPVRYAPQILVMVELPQSHLQNGGASTTVIFLLVY